MNASDARINRGGHFKRLLGGFIAVEPIEIEALAWAWLFIFAILMSYYIMRPIRDAMGVAGGVRNLPWLFTGLDAEPWSWRRGAGGGAATRPLSASLSACHCLCTSTRRGLRVLVARPFRKQKIECGSSSDGALHHELAALTLHEVPTK